MVKGRHAGKPLAFGFTAVTALLLAASVAFACVQTRGRIRVVGANGTSSTATGNGVHPGPGNVEYCGGRFGPKPGARVLQPTGFGGSQRPDVTVQLSVATACNPLPDRPTPIANVFADGNYDVMFCDGAVFVTNANGKVKDVSSNPGEENAHGGCFFTDAVTDRATLMGTMVVTNSAGSGTFKIPAGAAQNGPTDYAGVSVRRTGPPGVPLDGPPHVNMAPISII